MSAFSQTETPSLQTVSDMAAWQESIFLLQGDILKKLNSDLEVLQSVQITLPEIPFPPELPTPQNKEQTRSPTMETPQPPPQQAPTEIAAETGCVAADGKYVYVFLDNSLFVFDHQLVLIRSSLLE